MRRRKRNLRGADVVHLNRVKLGTNISVSSTYLKGVHPV